MGQETRENTVLDCNRKVGFRMYDTLALKIDFLDTEKLEKLPCKEKAVFLFLNIAKRCLMSIQKRFFSGRQKKD